MRYTHRHILRVFHVPYCSLPIAIVGALLCVLLMLGTSKATGYRLLAWTIIGQIIYFSYGYRHSNGRQIYRPQVINTPGAVRPILRTVAENNMHADIGLDVISEINNGHDEEIIENYL